MKRRFSYGTDSEFLRVRLTRVQMEKLIKLSKKISLPGTPPKATNAIRYLIEEAKV